MTPPVSWPNGWVGTWRDAGGKTVEVEGSTGGPLVTVRPSPGAAPAHTAELLGGGTRSVERRPAAVSFDVAGGCSLEIEGGTTGLGPVYRLRAVLAGGAGDEPAPLDAEVAAVVLAPEVVMGLYDDFDDDLGVPWAFPLLPLRRLG